MYGRKTLATLTFGLLLAGCSANEQLGANLRVLTIPQGGTGTSTAPAANQILVGDGTGKYIVDDISNYASAGGGSNWQATTTDAAGEALGFTALTPTSTSAGLYLNGTFQTESNVVVKAGLELDGGLSTINDQSFVFSSPVELTSGATTTALEVGSNTVTVPNILSYPLADGQLYVQGKAEVDSDLRVDGNSTTTGNHTISGQAIVGATPGPINNATLSVLGNITQGWQSIQNYIYFSAGYGMGWSTDATNRILYIDNADNDANSARANIQFRTGTSIAGLSSKAVITQAGSVGIATTTPGNTRSEKLAVVGPALIQGTGLWVENTSAQSALRVDRTDGKIGSLAAALNGASFNYDSSGNFGVRPRTRAEIESTSLSTIDLGLTMNGSGQVGINTTTPDGWWGSAAALVVNGGIFATSSATTTGGLYVNNDANTNLFSVDSSGNATTTQNLTIMAGTGFAGLMTHANSADRTYTLPDLSGTFAAWGDSQINNSVQRLGHSFVNYLANSSYEYWYAGTSVAPTGWETQSGGGTFAIARSSTASHGSYSAQVTFDTADDQLRQVIPAYANTRLTYTVFYQKLSGTGNAVNIVAQENGSDYTEYASAGLVTTVDGTWRIAHVTFTKPDDGTNSVRFKIASQDNDSSVWLFDETMFQEGLNVATAWTAACVDDTSAGQNIFGSKNFYSTVNIATTDSSGALGVATTTPGGWFGEKFTLSGGMFSLGSATTTGLYVNDAANVNYFAVDSAGNATSSSLVVGSDGTATSTLIIGNSDTTRGGCLVIEDNNQSGSYTYCSANGGTLTCGTTSCL